MIWKIPVDDFLKEMKHSHWVRTDEIDTLSFKNHWLRGCNAWETDLIITSLSKVEGKDPRKLPFPLQLLGESRDFEAILVRNSPRNYVGNFQLGYYIVN